MISSNTICDDKKHKKDIKKIDNLKLIHVTTVPETLGFFEGQITFMKKKGFEVNVISSPGHLLERFAKKEKIISYGVNMTRKITIIKDILSLIKLYLIFKKIKPIIMHAHTPKAGLLSVLAAKMAKVPIVIYTIHGLPITTAKGIKKILLYFSEKITCHLADRVFSVSKDNKKYVIKKKIVNEEKIKILASGSFCGVDAIEKFNKDNISPKIRYNIRKIYGINPSSIILGYVGRISNDKGITILEKSWRILKNKYNNIHLILVGEEDKSDPVPIPVLERMKIDKRVIFVGRKYNIRYYYVVMDILVLPTFREGFPIVPLEANAMEIPVIITNVDGCKEAIIDGVTGIHVPPGDHELLAKAIERLILDAELRKKMGKAGRERVLKEFRPENIWNELFENYKELIKNKILK